MSRTSDYSLWFDPAKGGVRLAVPYNGSRHNDLRQMFSVCKGMVTIYQFEDGEFESLEITGYPGAGLNLDAWGVKPASSPPAQELDPDMLGMALDLVDEEDARVGVVGRGRKVDRVVTEYRRLIAGESK